MKKCPKCESTNIIACEYWYGSPERYDGISEYQCKDCHYRQGRWTGQELKDGEVESRYGERGVVKPPVEKSSEKCKNGLDKET